jgi:hypothetical protein
VAVGWKLAHVRPDLRDQGFSRSAIDARDGVEEFDLLRERGDHLLDLGAKLADGLIEAVNVGQYLAHHEGMMGGEASLPEEPTWFTLTALIGRVTADR